MLMLRLRTFLLRKPDAVGHEVGHLMIQAVHEVQYIVGEEDSVIIPVQHKLEVVVAYSLVGHERGHHSPATHCIIR